MTHIMQRLTRRGLVLAMLVSALAAAPIYLLAADATDAAAKQRDLIKVLQSDAPKAQKAITCKELAIYGTPDAVPALAPLLEDPELASWARIALEAIPDSAVDDALRAALGKVQGRLLVGVINSIGVRRDAKSVGALTERLKDADADVASAAAEALGHIGGDAAATALKQSLADAPASVRGSVAQGCIFCAELALAQGQTADAVQLYDTVRQADVPKERQLEAIRGAILARQSAGIPLLLEQLRSPDKARFGIGLRVARELPGANVTQALAVELDQTPPARQPLLLLALADRNDAAVMPVLHKAIESGAKPLRLAALDVLQRSGTVECIPVLLQAATDPDADVAQSGKLALLKLEGPDVNAALLARLPQATGKARLALIQLAGERRITDALPVIVAAAGDSDADVRAAAVTSLGAIGEAPQAAALVSLLEKTATASERDGLEKALLALSARCGAACAPHLLPLAKSSDVALRLIALQALAAAGGPDALAAVAAAVNDSDDSVADEAVRTLSTWPGNWPEDAGVAEPLLALAKSGKKASYQVLGLRGYLQFVQGDKQLKDDERVARVKDLLPFIKRAEEKRVAIATLSGIPSTGVLDVLLTLAADPEVAEDACSAIVNLTAGELRNTAKEQCRTALQTVLEKTRNDATKKRATEALKKLD
jgi:HEAT repeat protein